MSFSTLTAMQLRVEVYRGFTVPSTFDFLLCTMLRQDLHDSKVSKTGESIPK